MARFLRRVLMLCAIVPLLVGATYTWTHPTTRVNGAALPLSEISYTLAETGTCNGLEFGELLDGAQIPAPASVFEVEHPVGTWCARFYTVDTAGVTSAPSSVVSYVSEENAPSPPRVLKVVWGAAFKVRVMPNGRIFLPYDTGESARYGAPCLAIPGLTEVYGFGLSEGIIAICD